MIKVYLAAAWSRREEMRQIATMLRADGISVVSRWLDEPGGLQMGESPSFLAHRAQIDLEDIRSCDVLARFADPVAEWCDPKLLTGARHTEMGYALALGKRLFVVGRCQNVFDYLPEVTLLAGVEALKYHLSNLERRPIEPPASNISYVDKL